MYIFVASEANISRPVVTCMMKPAQAQGRNLFASFVTGSSRNVSPIKRKSKIDVPPTSRMIPKICTVSITGNSHRDSLMAEPTDVSSSQWHITEMRCILLVLTVYDQVDQFCRTHCGHTLTLARVMGKMWSAPVKLPGSRVCHCLQYPDYLETFFACRSSYYR